LKLACIALSDEDTRENRARDDMFEKICFEPKIWLDLL